MGRHDRALNEQHQPVCEGIGVGYGGVARGLSEQRPDGTLMFASDCSRGRVGVQLTGHVDERAPAEPRPGEPVAERVEHGEHPVATLPLRHQGLQPVQPALIASLQVSLNEAALGSEVSVQRLQPDPGLRDNHVDADGLHAAGIEQPLGGVQDPLRGA